MKRSHERPSIGVLLCTTKDDEVVEYALARTTSPTLVAEYQTMLPSKALLGRKLHELYARLAPEDSGAEACTGANAREHPASGRRKLRGANTWACFRRRGGARMLVRSPSVTFDELLAEIAKEPPRTETREVQALPPGALERAAGGGLRLTDLLNDPNRTTERRTFRTGHLLGAPATPETIAEWEKRWHPLPDDLRSLLSRANGIHLWADLDEGRAYEGLAPIEEWMPARVKMWGTDAEPAYEALLHVGPELGVSVAELQAKRFGVHLVNIAEPKEGPSAGLAIALAMLSAATGRPVRRRVAVTGELSVHGNVNPVGGVAEKLSAALRQGRRLVVIPAENASELSRLEELATKLEIHPVRTLKEAVDLVLVEPQVETPDY